MRSLTTVRRLAVGATLSMGCVLCGTVPAFAKGPGGSQYDVEGTNQKDEGKTLESRIVFSGSTGNSRGMGPGSFTPESNWSPPACWYEPKWSPAEFAKQFQKDWDIPNASGVGEAYRLARQHYENGQPYEDFNESETGKGMWWDAVRDEDRADSGDPAAFACDTATFWVANGDTPKVKNAVSPEILAQLAYARIRIPDTQVSLAPEDTTKVNLPTWAWLDKTSFKKVSVTASLAVAGLNISATTTARPVSLTLEPGTPDAETYPASGACRINDDGSIGRPFARGKATETPPCGIKYLRASGDKPYELRATVAWEVQWTGTGGAGGDLPDGTFGKTQDVTVQEIQSVNR